MDNVNNKHNEVVYLNQNNQNPKYAKYFSTVKMVNLYQVSESLRSDGYQCDGR